MDPDGRLPQGVHEAVVVPRAVKKFTAVSVATRRKLTRGSGMCGQNNRKPSRCQAMTVSGFTMRLADRHSAHAP
jgi:hypothetical protein